MRARVQPWRFIYSQRGSSSWLSFLSVLSPHNKLWAEKASSLVLLVANKTFVLACMVILTILYES